MDPKSKEEKHEHAWRARPHDHLVEPVFAAMHKPRPARSWSLLLSWVLGAIFGGLLWWALISG